MLRWLRNIFSEGEKLGWSMAIFYNFLPARMLQPTYKHIAQTLPLENNGILLDIGTGPGFLALLIARKYPNLKIIGIDLSKTMIKIANKNKKDLPILEFKVMDGKKLEFSENSIDYIISTFALHHWRKPLEVFKEIYRVLKPDGQVFIYDGYSGISDNDIDLSLAYPLGIKLPKFFIKKVLSGHGFSKEGYEKNIKPLIAQCGFKEVALRPERVSMKIGLKKRL